MDAGRATIEAVETSVMRCHPELSINIRPPGDARFLHGITLHVKPDMAAEYTEYLQKLNAAAAKAAATPTVLHHNAAFGDGAMRVVVLPFTSWEQHAKWPNPTAVPFPFRMDTTIKSYWT